MKKLFYLLSIVFATTVLFSSCDDKNNPLPKEEVVSKIDTLKQGFDVDGNLVYAKIQFKKDSVFTYNDIEYRDCIVEFYNSYNHLITIIYDIDNNLIAKIYARYYLRRTIYNLTYEDIEKTKQHIFWVLYYEDNKYSTSYMHLQPDADYETDMNEFEMTQLEIDKCLSHIFRYE